jgi:hypothetical protein
MRSRTCAVYLVGLLLLMVSAPPASDDASISSPASHRHLLHPRGADPLPMPLHVFQSALAEAIGRDKGRIRLTDTTVPSLTRALVAPRAAAAAGPPPFASGSHDMLLRI